MHPKKRTQQRAGFRQLAPGLALALSALALPAQAQNNAATSTANGNQNGNGDEVVVLSPFTVSTEQDFGYRASNSISGTRTNTPIKDIPMDIQVFTKELTDDLVIKNQVDLEHYNASLVYGAADRRSDNPIQQPYQNFLFRGFRQNWGLRDGIREYDPIDIQGLERVEVVKGPAAALYGLSYPGGVMNNVSKKVDFNRNFTNTRITLGGEGDYRGTIDANYTGKGQIGEFGIRFNGAYERTADDRAHSDGAIRFTQTILEWRPSPETQAEFLMENGYRAKPNGLPAYFLQGGAGNSSVPLQIFHPEIPWTWNWANSRNTDSLDTHLYRGTLTQTFGENFSVQGYVQYSDRLEIPGNGWDANGSGGANSWEYPDSGWIRDRNVIRSTYHYRDWGNQMHAYGATAAYKFDVGEIKNVFSFGGAAWKEDELARASDVHDPSLSAVEYPVQNNVPIIIPQYPPQDLSPNFKTTPRGPNGEVGASNDGYHHENNSNDYYFANWQGRFFDERLKTNVGVNKTNIKLLTWSNGATVTPTNFEDDKVSPMFGAVYDITPEWSLFAVRAESLFPDSTKDSFGNQFAPIVGKSIEGGVKFNAFDGKFSGTLTAYKIDQTGGTQSQSPHENRNTFLWDTNPASQAQFMAQGLTRQDLLNQGDIVAAAGATSTGLEIDFNYSPTREWQFLVSIAHTNHEFDDPGSPTDGQTFPQAIKDRYSLLTKYTFTEGVAKGAYVGLGIFGGTKALQDYNGPDGKGRYEPARREVEAFGGFRFHVFEQEAMVQLNIKNLLKENDYIGWQPTADGSIATKMFKVPMPMIYRLTFGMDF